MIVVCLALGIVAAALITLWIRFKYLTADVYLLLSERQSRQLKERQDAEKAEAWRIQSFNEDWDAALAEQESRDAAEEERQEAEKQVAIQRYLQERRCAHCNKVIDAEVSYHPLSVDIPVGEEKSLELELRVCNDCMVYA